MPEPIDRTNLLNQLCEKCGGGCGDDKEKRCWKYKLIIEQPTIKAEPVRQGRWNYRHEDDWCYCTACGTDAEGSYGDCLETDYCPHCGAKMDLRTPTEVQLDEADSVMMGGAD